MSFLPELSRAARALLNWTQQDLADATGLSKPCIVHFEKGDKEPRETTRQAILEAFEDAGLIFPENNGVLRKADFVTFFRGKDALQRLWDDIFESLRTSGGEVLITNVDEKRALLAEKLALPLHIERLKAHGISERLLAREGDCTFLMPVHCYRWIPKDLFEASMSSYIYAGKVAFQLWGNSLITLIDSKEAFDAEKKRFEFLWSNAKAPIVQKYKKSKIIGAA